MNILKHLVLCILIIATVGASEWNYKFTYTSNIDSQMSLNCGQNKAIWIGWSHYGTRSSLIKRNDEEPIVVNPFNNDRILNFPNENDCWMNFTQKIAEQCNGGQQCDLSAQPTYIHKCGKISDYLYVSFKCIAEKDIYDICKPFTRTFTRHTKNPDFYIKSSDFPSEYPSSLDCSCSIASDKEQALKLEVLWFSLQDNDYVSMFNKNLTGWINPTYEMPIMTKTNKIRFLTDDSLAYKGFWLKVNSRKACRDDWQLVGDNCVKVFTENLDWRSANQRCQKMNGNLFKIDDVVSDLKLTKYMKSFYPEVDSYWIGLRKYVDVFNKERWMWSNNSTNYNDVSWWPWSPKFSNKNSNRKTKKTTKGPESYTNNCVVKKRNEDGYFTTTCDTENKNSFICQTNTLHTSLRSDIRLQCGKTSDIEAHLADLAAFEKIGVSSIQNYQSKKRVKPQRKRPTTLTTEPSILIQPVVDNNFIMNKNTDKTRKTTIRAELLKQFKNSKTTFPPENSIIHEKNRITENENIDTSKNLNTTVLAGIISGIGMVIVLINLGVLFICRRNLKKFLKSSKNPHHDSKSNSSSSNSTNQTSEILQDYFEAFSTLHHMNSKDPKAQLQILNEMNTALTLQTMKNTLPNNINSGNNNTNNRTVSMSSGDEPLMNESAKLFYNSQFFKNMTMKQTEATLANTSAFKPFIREVNDRTLSQQQLLQPIENNLLIRNNQGNNQNQYDKITHIQPGQAQFDNQYAHTYECLDNSENTINKRIQLGMLAASQRPYNQSLQSPNDNNINVSTSSTSSSSGASSTQHLLRSSQNNSLISAQHLQNLTPAQLATLNDIKMVLNNGNNNVNTNLQNNGFKCICGANSFGDVCNVCGNTNGSWSPDSAYYSSIPTMTNYGAYNIQSSMPQQQQFTSFNFNNHENNFKSHLV